MKHAAMLHSILRRTLTFDCDRNLPVFVLETQPDVMGIPHG
jgi:hypothetical protein